MTRILVVLLFCAAAQSGWWPYGVEPVPQEYAHHEPAVPVIRYAVPLDQVNSACHTFAKDTTNYGVDGCAFLTSFVCIAVVPQPDYYRGYGDEHVETIFAHEKYGHCNGLIHGPDGHGWIVAPPHREAE